MSNHYDPAEALADMFKGIEGEGVERVDLIYMGREYESTSGKTYYVYAEIEEGENDGRTYDYRGKSRRRYGAKKGGRNFVAGMPGTVYAFPEENNSIYSGRAVYLGQWRNKEDVIRWMAEDKAAAQAKAQDSAKKKEMKRDLSLERLAPFREAYRSARPADRPLLLGWIIKEITK